MTPRRTKQRLSVCLICLLILTALLPAFAGRSSADSPTVRMGFFEFGGMFEGAEDGAVAVKTVLEKGAAYYDFILMDIQMPVMNGYEATKAIRALPNGERVPIIALSANAFEEDKQRSFEAGMNDHVAKPINVKILLETLQKLTKEERKKRL